MNQNFARVTLARFCFTIAVQAQAVLMGWQMYELTHDPLKLGLIGLAAAIPALSLALFAGLWVDRGNPLRFYQAVIGISLISVLISWHATSEFNLYVAAILTGIMRSFTGPSMNSLVPKIVTREELRQASAYSTTANRMGVVIGPALAGILLGIQGYSLPYLLIVVFLVVGSLSLLWVQYRHVKNTAHVVERKSVVHELMVGVKFVANHRLLLSALSLDMFAVLFGGVTAMLPVFAAEVLKVGPSGLGYLRAAPALGAILMGFYLIKNPVKKNAGRWLFISVLGFGFCILVFAFSKNYFLSLAVLALSGALDSVSMVVRGAIVQLCSPEAMRGRIAAVNSMFIGSSNELGEFESGLAASTLGLIPSVVFGGTMTLLTVVLVFWKARELRSLDLSKL